MSQKKLVNPFLKQLEEDKGFVFNGKALLLQKIEGATIAKEALVSAETNMLLALAQSLESLLTETHTGLYSEKEITDTLVELVKTYISLRSSFIVQINSEYEHSLASIESAQLQFDKVPMH